MSKSITITKEEFMDIVTDVIAKESLKGGLMLGMVFSIFSAKLTTRLFDKEEEK